MKKIRELYNHFLSSKGVSTDSRQVGKDELFFALSGDNFNGNKFAADALESGASLCVIDDERYHTDERCFLVDDVLATLQALAKYHRKQSKVKVIAITGSNGKTTTKELISAVLRDHTAIISTAGNDNNHIGVPLTLLTIRESTKIAVVEMGANHVGEIGFLCSLALPDIGLITNIGKAHLDGFGSFEGVITAKSELYEHIRKANGHVILNSDDSLLVRLAEGIASTTYGKNNADVEGEITDAVPLLNLKWGYNQIVTTCNTQLYGNYNFTNILAAITTGIYFGVDAKTINSSIEAYVSNNNRSQQIKTNNNRIILDAYNANPYSMTEALSSFYESKFENPWVLLGDMFELGDYSLAEHQSIIDKIVGYGFDNVVLIGDEFNHVRDDNFIYFHNTKEAIEYMKDNRITDADILIKGSRGMKMEALLEVL